MKICWDNLDNIYLTRNGNFRYIGGSQLYYHESCGVCGEPHLGHRNSRFCSHQCATTYKRSKESRQVFYTYICMNCKVKFKSPRKDCKYCCHACFGKHRQITYYTHTCQACGKDFKVGSRKRDYKYCSHACNNTGQGYGGLAGYDTFAPQISYAEEIRALPSDPRILQCRCVWCNVWYSPQHSAVRSRINALNGKEGPGTEMRLYCSDECKNLCPNYWVKPDQQMMRDKFMNGKGIDHREFSREVQPQLRKLVFARDNWVCIKCGSTKSLHCHHIEGINWAPLESADVDMCMTVCKRCHKKIHKIEGCSYVDMRCKEI